MSNRGAGALLALLLFALLATAANAQTNLTVRVRVTDTAGVPIPAATVSVLSAANRLLGSGATDSGGRHVLRVQGPGESLQLVVQRIGFLGTRRVLRHPSTSEAAIDVSLAPVSATLDTVRATGRSTQLAAQPVIQGAEIVSSPRGVFDLVDVLRKLRPTLFAHMQDDIRYKCQPSSMTGPFRTYINERPIPYFPDTFDELLHEVKSDAIDEMRYVSCFDRALSSDDHPNVGRLYITLRKGYAYNLKLGTYREAAQAARIAAAPDTTVLRPLHARLVGVYDGTDGTPIEGAEVIDVLTGYSAKTTRTGTVALSFVDSNGTLLKIQRAGYVPFSSPVTNRASDNPLTITMVPRGRAEARLAHVPNPSDTVRKLVVSGFYERRDTMPVPSNALVSEARIAGLAHLSDAGAVMARPICSENLFVDGARLNGVSNIESIVSVAWIVGIETYVDAEVDVAFAPRAAGPRCATLIWTR